MGFTRGVTPPWFMVMHLHYQFQGRKVALKLSVFCQVPLSTLVLQCLIPCNYTTKLIVIQHLVFKLVLYHLNEITVEKEVSYLATSLGDGFS